jgi:DNA polymerase-3 subunit chi
VGKAMFYHLTRHPMEDTLAMLLGKARRAGWRVVVRGKSDERLAWLDEKLWLGGAGEDFLPHGLSGGPHDALQPVLLTRGSDLPNGASCLMVIDGAEMTAAEVDALERVCVLFDGSTPEALDNARSQWRSLQSAGVLAEYWSEESGKWQKKSQTG